MHFYSLLLIDEYGDLYHIIVEILNSMKFFRNTNVAWYIFLPQKNSVCNIIIVKRFQCVIQSCILLGLCYCVSVCRIVRLISPNLNYFIILGAILIYTSVIFFVFPTLDPFLVTFACHVSCAYNTRSPILNTLNNYYIHIHTSVIAMH